jgi:hypothetical protein
MIVDKQERQGDKSFTVRGKRSVAGDLASMAFCGQAE